MENEIASYLDTVDNWRVWKMIFIIPIFVFVPLLVPKAFWTVLTMQLDGDIILNLYNFEYKLALPTKPLFYLGVILSILFLICVIGRGKNKIKAIKTPNFILLILFSFFYYQMVLLFQAFSSFFILRIVNWLFFIGSIGYIFYMYFTKNYDGINLLTKNRVNKLAKLSGILWFSFLLAGFIFQEISSLKHVFYASIAPFMPVITIILSLCVFVNLFEGLDNLKKIDHNQEYYREKYGYTVLEWYGSKSKEYKAMLKDKMH